MESSNEDQFWQQEQPNPSIFLPEINQKTDVLISEKWRNTDLSIPNQITSHGEKLYNLCPLNFVFILGFSLILILRIIKSILSMVNYHLLVLKIQVIFL